MICYRITTTGARNTKANCSSRRI